MERLQKAAVLTELADRLRREGSWCGHTHMQKATYFLQVLLGVPTGYEFILYMYGPYSFDLSEELAGLRADYLIEFDHKSPGYGPGLVPTPTSESLRSGYSITLAKHAREIDFVARTLGAKGVADLEKLATALYVTREDSSSGSVEGRARRLVELKPHISFAQALDAVREFDRIAREVEGLAQRDADEHLIRQAAN
jgi:uncharacterized protein YwgA